MRIKAKYVGADSTEHVYGQEYELFVGHSAIERIGSSGFREYSSIKIFFDNWDNVKILEK